MAQAESIFNGIQLGESLASVQIKLKEITGSVKKIEVSHPSFPLAAKTEVHLVCNNIKTKNGNIALAVFTLADDKLVYIEAKGNAVKCLISKRKDTAINYLSYQIYLSDLLVADNKKDIIKILTPDAAQFNLFTWENPYLHTSINKVPVYNPSAEIPDFIKMTGQLNELMPRLKAKSVIMTKEELDGSDPNAQIQLNCFGVEFAGFPRKIEARFGNNTLNAVWIITAKAEESRIQSKLMEAYGKSIFENDKWEVFHDWQVLLRKDVPEILLLTKELGIKYKEDLSK